LTDQELISMLLNPVESEKGFRLLISQYKEQIYYVIRRIVLVHEDADDVFQNTMIKVFKNIKNFEFKSSLYTWVYKIATNESLTHLRIRKRLGNFDNNIPENISDNLLTSDEYFEGDRLQLELQKAVAALPEKQKEVFNLKYYEEMKYSDMSKLLDTSEGALKASYFHAVKKIEAFIKKSNII
jgi:RNA polymerase sigma factor (sigma-70 family)